MGSARSFGFCLDSADELCCLQADRRPASTKKGNSVCKTRTELHLDLRTLEMDQGQIYLGARSLGQEASWKSLGPWPLGKKRPSLGMDQGSLEKEIDTSGVHFISSIR